MAQRMKARAKTVQKMTRDGLVQENLGEHSSVRISSRERDRRMVRKDHTGSDQRVFSPHSSSFSRDGPDRRSYKTRKRKRPKNRGFLEETEIAVSLGEGEESGFAERDDLGESGSLKTVSKSKSQRYMSDSVTGGRLSGGSLLKSVSGQPEKIKDSADHKLRQKKRLVYQNAASSENVQERADTLKSEKGQSNPNSKLAQKKRNLSESRGDSRRQENGGTTRPQDKKRLQFAYEESGPTDLEKETFKKKQRRRNSREQSERYQNTDYLNLREDKETARTQKLLQESERKASPAKVRAHSQKEKVLRQEIEGKKVSKLMHGEPASQSKKSIAATGLTMTAAMVRQKIRESDDGNAAVEGTLSLEEGRQGRKRLMEASARSRNRRKNRGIVRQQRRADKEEVKALYQEALQKDQKLRSSSLLKKQIQKARIKREYAKAKYMSQEAVGAPVGTIDYIKKVGGKLTDFFKEHRKLYIMLGLLLGIIMLVTTSFTSCSIMFMNNVVDYSGYSYMSTDQAIRDADLYYTQLEANLQEQINQMETENTGYDRYRYDIGAIGHDPFVLISYLSAKYGVFEFDDTIKQELDTLFELQYGLSTQSSNETITETKKVKVGESLGQVVTSGYCNCSICCGQWSGGPTASGAYPTANHTIAVDASTPTVPMGTKVVMNGVEYTVEDTGNFTQYGVDFDVYYDSHEAASNHGHQTWEAYLADDNGTQEIEVTTTSQESVFSVTVTSNSLTAICQDRLDDEQKEWYDGYNHVKGNLQMFSTPIDYDWYNLVSSKYGYRINPITGENQLHNGMDIAAPEGTPVLAGLTGTVTSASYNDDYGNYVILEDDKGYEIRYAHLNSISVSAGDSIEKEMEIGTVGSTGSSTGNHLHIELLHNGERLNPIFYFEAGEETLNVGDVEYSSDAAQRLCEFAVQFQGTPYVWGGYDPSGFDCSGFVSYCLTYSGVKNVGHLTTWGLIDCCTIIPESEMMPGDIIFFQGTYSADPPTHVAIYLGNGQMVHSGHPNQITSIYNSYWQEHWYCVGRW